MLIPKRPSVALRFFENSRPRPGCSHPISIGGLLLTPTSAGSFIPIMAGKWTQPCPNIAAVNWSASLSPKLRPLPFSVSAAQWRCLSSRPIPLFSCRSTSSPSLPPPPSPSSRSSSSQSVPSFPAASGKSEVRSQKLEVRALAPCSLALGFHQNRVASLRSR